MANLTRWAGEVRRRLLDLLLPPQCVACQRVGTWLCKTCARKLNIFTGPLCPRCGRPTSEPVLCSVCQQAPLLVNPVRSTFIFEDTLREALHALKYRGGTSVVETLTEPMVRAWRFFELESDLLVPVPLHHEREAERGYNQAALLSTALGWQLGLPVASKLLHRVRYTPSQTKLNREERRQNVKDAFACLPNVELTGRRMTLIDDVATTGATLDACAVVLLEAGAAAVNAFTLARAP